MKQRIYRPRDIARILNVSRSHVHRMLRDGRLHRVQLGKRIIGTTRESLEELIQREYPDLLDDIE